MKSTGQRSSTDRGRATLTRILEAASELFYRHGVRATGLDHVAQASATGKGQLYHYFTDKHDLVLAVVEYQIDSVLAYQEPLLSSFDSLTGLRQWVDVLVSGYESGDEPARCPLGSLVAELAPEDPQARAALGRGFAEWSRRLARGLRAIQERGELAPEADLEQLASGLLAAYQGGLVLAQASDDVSPVRQALTLALECCTQTGTIDAGTAE